MTIINDMDFAGKRVILADGSDIGVVTDIYADTRDWRITKFDVRIEKRYVDRLGLEKGILKKTVASIKIHHLNKVADVVTLKGGIDDLARSFKKVLPAAERAKEPKAKKPPKAPPKPATRPATPPPADKDRPRSL